MNRRAILLGSTAVLAALPTFHMPRPVPDSVRAALRAHNDHAFDAQALVDMSDEDFAEAAKSDKFRAMLIGGTA